jgi:hypothetical protein
MGRFGCSANQKNFNLAKFGIDLDFDLDFNLLVGYGLFELKLIFNMVSLCK